MKDSTRLHTVGILSAGPRPRIPHSSSTLSVDVLEITPQARAHVAPELPRMKKLIHPAKAQCSWPG